MRIIGGSAGGMLLKAPKGFEVRPTPDLVRQAVFNSLGSRVQAARVLELFAGTGALSLECLSRGAALALCVEKSSRHAQFIRRNLEQARLTACRSACKTPSPRSGSWPVKVNNSI
jgi:16S rRNA (guanine966-N2)-methyltransferase